MVGLMLRTGIAVSVWEQEGSTVIETALDILAPTKKGVDEWPE
jgi:hypothetical protein